MHLGRPLAVGQSIDDKWREDMDPNAKLFFLFKTYLNGVMLQFK